MASRGGDLCWVDEEDEIPITVDAGIFSKPNLYENDPLAGAHHQEDPLEEKGPTRTVEKGIGGRTRSSLRVKAATLAPYTKTVLSCPPPGTSVTSHNRIPSYSSKGSFTAEMDRDIVSIIDESIKLFGLDPRGYHPFYLRIYKYIVIGQQKNYIKSTKDVNYCWEKYDRICAQVMKEPKTKTTFIGTESPYATFMKTGKVVINGKEVNLKRNEDEIKKRFMELEKSANDIVNQSKKSGSKSVLVDLNTRLQFFHQCKSMTFPADCVKMNNLWHRVIYESSHPSKQQRVGVKRTDEANDLHLPLVPVPKLSLQTETKSQTSSAVDVEITKLEDEDDCRSQMDFDLDVPPTKDVPMDVDVKSKPATQANCSQSAERGRKHKTDIDEMAEFHLPVIKIKIKIPVSNEKSHFPSSQKSEKPPIKPKRKLKIGVVRGRARQEQKKRFKLSQLKVTHALKKLKLKRKGSTLMKKQAKLENMICSGAYFSKVKSSFKDKHNLKNESSPADAIAEESQISPPPSLLLPTLVAVDHMDKHTATDHSSIDKSVVENAVSLDRETPPTQPTNRKVKSATCDRCGKVLQKSSLKYHKFHVHGVLTRAPQVQLSTLPIVNQPTKKGSWVCDICGLVLKTTKNLRMHKLSKHRPNRIRKKAKCPICLEEFLMVWPHFQEVHIQGKEGLEKGTTNTSTDNIDNDDVVAPPPKRANGDRQNSSGLVICEICGKYFPYVAINRHMEQIHGTNEKPFLCQECPKQFKANYTLDAHIRQVHLGENYRCDICSRVMQSGGKLWRHKVDVHGMTELEPPPGLTLMQCEYCGEKLLRGMLQHIHKNHPEHAEKHRFVRRRFVSEEAKKRENEKKRAERIEWRTTGKPSRRVQYFEARRRRMNSMGITESWTCPIPNCRKYFLSNIIFESHLRKGHGSEDNLIQTLEEIQLLKNTPNETWQCAVCEQNMGCIDEVKVHFTFNHQQTLKKIRDNNLISSANIIEALYCPHCREKLGTDQALREHVKGSHPEMCCKCPGLGCEWLVISPIDLQEHFMLEHTDPNPIMEWIKQKDNLKATRDSTMKESNSGVKTKKKPVTKLKEKRPQPSRPPPRAKKRRNGRRQLPKYKDRNSKSSSESSADDDDDFPTTVRFVPRGVSSVPTRRSCRNSKSRYKTKDAALANFSDFKLHQCQVYVKRLSKAEISFYCKSSL